MVSFVTVEDAIKIRQILDGETVLDNRVRVYFGQETKMDPGDQHLRAPPSQKQFFISPPPSPPMGWEMRNEGPPNREVHAEDLATALSKLHARNPAPDDWQDGTEQQPQGKTTFSGNRQRSGSSTVVYDPQDHGHSPDLPAIAVEDTSATPDPLTPMEGVEKKFIHTARPPVELMEES